MSDVAKSDGTPCQSSAVGKCTSLSVEQNLEVQGKMTSQDNADLESMPGHLTEDFFAAALEASLRVGAVQVLDVQLQRSSSGGENYCSNIYQVLVKYQCHNGAAAPTASSTTVAAEQRSLIVKCMPWHKQGVLRRLAIYDKELHFYLDIMPAMETLMWQATRRPWRLGGQHIYATARPEQTLVFDDLCASGFRMLSRQHGLDAAHAAAVLRKLGEYHALSLRWAEHDSCTFEARYPYGLLNEASIRAPPFKALFGAQLLKLIALLAKCDDDAQLQHISQLLMRYYEDFTQRVLNTVWQTRRGRWNVLCHGDLWVNNIFFRYDEEDREAAQPVEVRFIDFQLCFYGSIGFDLNYFLNTSVELEVLRTQRCTLLGSYYDALYQTLQQLQCSKIALPTFDDVLREVEEREAYGLFVAFGFFPLMTMVRAESQDNSLKNFQDAEFARRKIALMFESNPRTLATLKNSLKRWHDMGILN